MAKPKTPEEIRAARIADLQDPEARAAIKKVQEERVIRLLEVVANQKLSYDQRVADLVRQRAAARDDLQLTRLGVIQHSLGLHAGMNKLKSEVERDIVRSYNQQIKAERLPFDRKIDRMLDAAERKQEHAQRQILHREPPDRSDR
jgi:hypothetical protein